MPQLRRPRERRRAQRHRGARRDAQVERQHEPRDARQRGDPGGVAGERDLAHRRHVEVDCLLQVPERGRVARRDRVQQPQVLNGVAIAWRDQRAEILEQSSQIVERLAGAARLQAPDAELDPASLDAAVAALARDYDAERGGFNRRAPKFPAASVIELLLRRAAARAPADPRAIGSASAAPEREMALHTLRAMATGGIYDQVGGGFARYSVDAAWIVPHFEKMLYDNALLARAYLHGFQVSGDRLLERVCTETLDWALRELRQPEGGFASALDADSEGVEGKYYVWTTAEVREALGDELGAVAIDHFGMSEDGNFEGRNIPVRATPDPPQLAEIKRGLYAARERRVRPGLDDKRLTAWNALMISALADAGAVLGREDYLDAARTCADFVQRDLRDADGRLLRTYNHGRGRLRAYLEDHAFLLEALLTLYEATFEPRWFDAARELAETIIERFADPEQGGFFSTPSDGEQLVTRRKELEDAPIPSGASAATVGLLRLAALTGARPSRRGTPPLPPSPAASTRWGRNAERTTRSSGSRFSPTSATSRTVARWKSIACSRWPKATGCCGAIVCSSRIVPAAASS